jgi:hypothetical protein
MIIGRKANLDAGRTRSGSRASSAVLLSSRNTRVRTATEPTSEQLAPIDVGVADQVHDLGRRGTP